MSQPVLNKSVGTFGTWQSIYADKGIATFPVSIEGGEKKPAVTGYLDTSLEQSESLAQKHGEKDAFGFALGPKSNITVLDIDAPEENVLISAMDRHGESPIIVRSGSGNHHVWYRHSGEQRQIRPDSGEPIDILGGGYVIAPPSNGNQTHYEFIQGSLDDLDKLPALQRRDDSVVDPSFVGIGNRNESLWQHCMRQAHHCDDLNALIDVARTFNEGFLSQLDDGEVIKAAKSAWKCTERGENRFGQTGSWSSTEEVDWLLPKDPYAYCLLQFLRAHNGPDREFFITNGLAEKLRWTRKRLSAARNNLIGYGYIRQTRAASQNGPALYRWQRIHGGQNRPPILNQHPPLL
jgi:hypothetical protein